MPVAPTVTSVTPNVWPAGRGDRGRHHWQRVHAGGGGDRGRVPGDRHHLRERDEDHGGDASRARGRVPRTSAVTTTGGTATRAGGFTYLADVVTDETQGDAGQAVPPGTDFLQPAI